MSNLIRFERQPQLRLTSRQSSLEIFQAARRSSRYWSQRLMKLMCRRRRVMTLACFTTSSSVGRLRARRAAVILAMASGVCLRPFRPWEIF